jgi:hypothetical protein
MVKPLRPLLVLLCTFSLCAEAEEHSGVVIVAANPACSVLNGVGINVQLENPVSKHSRKVMELNRLLSKFCADHCDWNPYWQSDRGPRTEPSDFKVSLHRRPDGAQVCIIANWSGAGKHGALQVSRDGQCRDFLTRAALTHAHRKLPLTLPGYGCQVTQTYAAQTAMN